MLLSPDVDYNAEETNALDDTNIEPFLSESGRKFDEKMKKYTELRNLAEQIHEVSSGHQAAPSEFQKLSDTPIGQGTFGEVWPVEDKSSRDRFAVKIIITGPGSSQVSSNEAVANEVQIMKKLSHHHITTLALWAREGNVHSLYMRPLAQCNLHDYLTYSPKCDKYETTRVYTWFSCLVGALDYAHRCGIKHKDIKPANILIDEDGNRILLTDFGLAVDFSKSGISRTTGPFVVGTSKYHAPECTTTGERTEAVDIFALGCVYTEIMRRLDGKLPEEFEEMREGWGGASFKQCLDGLRKWLMEQKEKEGNEKKQGNEKRVGISKETRAMLSKDATDRPTARDVREAFNRVGLRCDRCPN